MYEPFGIREKLGSSRYHRKAVLFTIVLLSLFLCSFATVSSATVNGSFDNVGGYFVTSLNSRGSLDVGGDWEVPTPGNCGAIGTLSYTISITQQDNTSGSVMELYCALGAKVPTMYMEYEFDNQFYLLPGQDAIAPGDSMTATVVFSAATNAVSIIIKDITKNWVFNTPAGLTSQALAPQKVSWVLVGPINYLPVSFTSFPTSVDNASIDGKGGAIGFFTNAAGVTLVDASYVDSTNGHVLVAPTAVNIQSTGFVMRFLQID